MPGFPVQMRDLLIAGMAMANREWQHPAEMADGINLEHSKTDLSF
jgi:hypothetical protein